MSMVDTDRFPKEVEHIRCTQCQGNGLDQDICLSKSQVVEHFSNRGLDNFELIQIAGQYDYLYKQAPFLDPIRHWTNNDLLDLAFLRALTPKEKN